MITDATVFLEHKRLLEIPVNNGQKISYVVRLNMPVSLYYKVLSAMVCFSESKDVKQQAELIIDVVTDIINYSGGQVSRQWITANISIENLLSIVTHIIEGIQSLLNQDIFEIPDIQIENDDTDIEKSKRDKRKQLEIERYTEIISQSNYQSMIDDIVLVMQDTGNSYQDIMEMPILVFRDIVKTIAVNRLRQNENWNLKYLKYLADKLGNDLKKVSNRPSASKEKKGADLQGLKRLLSSK